MLRLMLTEILGMQNARKVVFIHIPKCAGSSINWHFKKNLGSARSGRTQMLNAIRIARTGERPCDDALRSAQFVAGHCGRDDVRNLSQSHFCFTVLRNPVERTLSFYDSCRNLDSEKRAPFFPIAAAKELSFEAFCNSSEPSIRMFVDNVQTRTLANCYTRLYDQQLDDWEAQAEKHLKDLDFVTVSEKLDVHLPHLCEMIGLPAPKRTVRRNVRKKKENCDLPDLQAAAKILGERVEADQRLYKIALQLAQQLD